MNNNFQAKLDKIQLLLKKYQLDGWFLYDFRRTNQIALSILEIADDQFLTRRYFYFIPSDGQPIKIVHNIEPFTLDHLPGSKKIYNTWQTLHEAIKLTLANSKKIAMEYSPMNAIPYASKIDGGTLDLIRSFGVSVHSSANISQFFDATLNQKQKQDQFEAAKHLRESVELAFNFIGSKISNQEKVTEYNVQEFILAEFEKRNIYTESGPHCAKNENSADPHYEATKTRSAEINKGDIILIDLWAKYKSQNSIYADITWMGFAGEKPSAKYKEVFDVVAGARDAAVEFLKNEYPKREVLGCEVDDVSRSYISQKGYHEYFIHRTGHSLGENVHGNGANIDNFETQDRRELIPNSSFTIEPGIYLPNEFGVRLELNIVLSEKREIIIPGEPLQKEIFLINC